MIKAFKRKTNNTAAATATKPDATSSESKRSSAVNCMHLSDGSVCDNCDASNSNIYTEIELNNALPKDLVIQSNASTSSESISSDILRILFNESKLFSDQSQTNHTNSYVNESVTTQAIARMEIDNAEQNPYEIDSGAHGVASHQIQVSTSHVSDKSNVFFANISKSFKQKIRQIVSEDGDESGSESTDAQTNQLAKDVVDKSSLKKRLANKLKTGLQFFKDSKVRRRYLAHNNASSAMAFGDTSVASASTSY